MEVAHTQYSMATKPNMLWLTSLPPREYGDPCLNFFNESWVCFTDNVKAHLYVNMTIEPNDPVSMYGCQRDCPWHLHDISQPALTLPYVYTFNDLRQNGNTPVYVLDTWIDTQHPEFEGRVQMGAHFTQGSSNGHGTHVAGLIASRTFGVNKRARVVGVQVLDDHGFGSWQTILTGMQWVSTQPVGIINMSIGGGKSMIVNRLVRAMSARGWRFVVAAGNDYQDACNYSPASAYEAVTVGAVDSSTKFSQFSNYGKCLDLLAPGDSVLSTWPGGLLAYMSGTSMAAPIVAGLWSLYPEWDRHKIVRASRARVVSMLPLGTTNREAYVNNGHC
jgi:hypothetical protein